MSDPALRKVDDANATSRSSGVPARDLPGQRRYSSAPVPSPARRFALSSSASRRGAHQQKPVASAMLTPPETRFSPISSLSSCIRRIHSWGSSRI